MKEKVATDIIELLIQAKEQGVNLFLENDKLRFTSAQNKPVAPELLGLLKENKAEIIAFLQSDVGNLTRKEQTQETITPQAIEGNLPLSYAQQHVWFIDTLQGSTDYHMPSVYKLFGKLDVDAFEKAVQQLMDRHLILKTVYREQDGKPFQKVLTNYQWKLGYYSLVELGGNEELPAFIQQTINKPFNLSDESPLRIELVHCNEDEHLLILVLHHIACDGSSIPIFMKEIEQIYQAIIGNHPTALAELPIQYADYAIWQKDEVNEQQLTEQLNYWHQQLTNTEDLALHTDYPRTNQPTNEGAELSFVLPKTVSEQLERLALQEDATLFMVLLSAINILLHKYTGQHHFSVGTPIANRTKDELANLIGFFANTLALQSDLDSKLSYHDYLQQLKQHVLDAYSNQQVPFEKIVNQEVKKRDMSKNPIFQVMLTLNNQFSTASTAATWLGCQMETVDFEIETSQFDLSFDVVRVPDGFVFSINYRTDLFKEARIKQMQNHLVQLFESILQDTDQTIAQLRILTAEEELVLDNFSQAPTSTELAHATIIDFVEEQVAQSPQRQAIVLEDAAMTYEELATRSNQLAHYLTSQGVGKQARVAICLSPSADTIVAILGIMKAGAAYIPIDVNYPQQRIQFILADTAANAFIGNTDSIQLVANTPALLVVDIAKAQDRIRQQPSTSIINCVATDPAYIIYTSGSTGKPKGVLVEHQSLAMRIHTEAELLDASASTVTCLLTKYVFDVSLLEIFIPLLSGGKMVIPTDHMIYQPDLLLDLLAKHAVTLLQGTPSFFTPLVYAIEPEQSQQLQLKTLCIGGESLTTSLVEMIQEKLPQVQINNHYGPTEITIDATYLPNVTSFECNSIGKPLPNNTIYILDSALQKVPIGVPGDLYVGGSGLAREYINLPALTQEKFIAHPFQSSERLYKTGDVACWLPNGEIEFLGRKDNQVKVRGYRIELGEIEHALMSLDEIVQAVVVVKADQKGHKRLIAYIIPTDNYKQQQVQQQLQSQLPEYMIPRVMMELESFPTNFSGKVAVDQLPDPVMSELIDSKHVAPRSTVEKQLATIWQELLGLEAVGIHDNFFELGGDSIITIQVVSRAKRFSLQLKPRDLFEAQTIEKLAGVVEKRSKLIVGEQGLLTGDVPLMPIQQQWFAEGEYPEMSHFNQDMLLSLDKALLEAHLAEAVRALTTHHDALRFKYTKHENGWQQTYGSHEGQVSVVNLQDVQADQLPQEIEATCTQYQQSLSIEHGELVRWVLIQTPESEAYNRLFICIHHLAVDGVSWRILLDDLERSLKAVSTNQPIELGAKGSSYRAFVEALTNYATQDRIVDEQAYWKEMGKNTLPLPVDKEEQQPTLQEVERYMISLSAEHTEALLREVHQAYGTEINDLLLAALAKTLSEWAKYEKVLIGLEGHGREDIDSNLDISQTVGWFTNLYPIALSAPKNKQLDHWIKSVKEALRGIPSKGLGYSALRFLHPDKAIQPELAAIQPELIFNYLGQLDHIINEDAFFKGAAESRGESSSHASPFIPKLELNSSIGGGQLHMSWAYANTQYHAATIEQLATNYLNNLKTLIAHCQTVEQQQHTPSDFGLQGKVDFQELDSFLDTLENGQPRRALLQDIYSLSPMQEGMLFHGLYNTSSTAYTEQLSFDLHEVDVELLKKSWEYITEHHTVCRTRFFHNALSSPIQCVYRKVEVPFECFDYSNEQADHLSEKIDAFMQADIERGFTFDEVPLMRISLIKQTEKLHTMVWTSHHMLMDGWSLPIIIKDLLTAYEHFSQKQLAPAIPEDQYGKYIHFLAGLDGYAEQRFWKSYLAPLEQPTLLPFIGSTKERNKGGGEMDEMDLVLNPDVTEKIRQYAQENRITVNTVMQGVWAMLLAKYTGNESIAFGVTVSGRPPELEGAEQGVGLYINTIPICAQMDASMPMITWLQELQKGHTDAREFQYTALNKIHKWSGLHGDIFDNTLAFENFPIEKELANQWALKMGNVRSYERNNYLLSLTVKLGLQLVVNFRFNKSLLPTAYIEQVRSHFDTVLHQIITEKSIKQGAVNMVSTLEQQTLQEEFNNTAFAYPKQTNLVAQFEQQAAKSPDATALYFQNEAVSYHEFHRKVNQFAHYLKKQGVKKGDKVGICLERSVEMLVSIFGVLKVGAVYVPIDPQYPDTRVDFMLADAGIQVVITNAVYNRTFMFFEPLFEEREGIHSIIWEEAQDEIDAESDECASEEILLSDPAYVMYTSGTTGTPKGILVTHQNIFKLVMEPNDIAVQADDRVLQWSNFVFDGSTYDIYSALLKGAALHLISKEEARDVTQLARIIQEQQITVCFMTTALFNGFVNYDVEAFKGMRKLLFGGQLVSIPHVKKALEKLGPNVLVHVYGPTETTVYATYYPINHIENNLVPIGKPLANTSVYILSPQNQLAGIGVVGEICIGGDGVALGYLNRAELSKEKFVPDPFSSRENAKMYRTGDLARWLPNGCIDFVGRTDDQVKVRGYRIELGEVETVLQQAPELKECLVVAIDDGQNNKKLIAYVVGSQQYDADQVQEFLKVKLPAYMIPAMIIELAAFPLTPNGKIDKKALPEPTLTQSQEDDTYEAPRNETESLLVHSWEQTLKLERIGIHDNFFSVGGDSILAIRIISAVKKHFQVEISISDFYQSPSIAQLAELIALKQNSNNELEDLRNEVIEHMDQVKAATLAVIPNPETIEDVFPMSDIQKGMIFASEMNPDLPIYHDQMMYLLPFIEPERYEKALNLLVEKHAIFRTTFNLTDYSEEVQIVHRHEPVTIDYQDIRELSRAEQQAFLQNYVAEARKHPFDVKNGPLWKTSVFRVDDNYMAYLFQFHHAILDGWSFASLNTEWMNLCLSLQENPDIVPEKLSISYKDGVIDSLVEKSNPVSLDFWKKEMEDYTRFDIFESDDIYQDERVVYGIQFFERIKAVAQQLDVAPKTVCFGAYLFAMNMFQYEGDLTTGVVSNLRPLHEDGDKVLGCFLNTVPFRLDMHAQQSSNSWAVYLKELEQKLRNLKGLDRLTLLEIARITGENSSDGNPFFDVLFNYVDFHVYSNIQSSEEAETVPSHEEEAQESEETLEMVSHESTNTYLDISVSTTGGMMMIYYTLRKKLKHGFELKDIVHYFDTFLHAIVDDPYSAIALDASLPAKDRLLNEFNATTVEYPNQGSIVARIREQAAQRPNEIAIVDGATTFSYQELDQRSEQLAYYLQANGGQNTQIAVCLERSADMLIALLGILKAGAAYVPIDINYPSDRIRYMVEETAASFIITKQALSHLVPQHANLLCIDTDWAKIADSPASSLAPIDLASNAYIIFTSGSTGRPKGVMVSHEALMNLVNWHNDAYQVDATSKATLLAGVGFDAFTWELWPYLAIGACVFVVDDEQRLLPESILAFYNTHAISHSFMPTALIPHFVEVSRGKEIALNYLLTGGDALSPIATSDLSYTLVNNYGPTENAVVATYYPMPISAELMLAPIGLPISNVQVYLLGKSGYLVPEGAIGELCIGGKSLATGYLNQEALTDEQFIANPFGEGRLYKTGDLARWLPDGNLEYMGRVDAQVQIRGYRIELGEIEHCLQELPQVEQAVVIAKEDEKHVKRLIAYLVGTSDELNTTELQQALKETLPDYMVPAIMVPMESFPLTANGKIDKKALPNPDVSALLDSEYAAPRNQLESELVDIWQHLLHAEKVGIHDNFFELGGDSIITIQVASRVKQLGYALQPREVFQNQTIAELAVAIANKSDMIAGEQGVLEGAVGLLPVQQWFLASPYEGMNHFNQDMLIKLPKDITQHEVQQAIEALVMHHDALRMTYEQKNGKWHQSYRAAVRAKLVTTQVTETAQKLFAAEVHKICTHYQTQMDIEAGEIMQVVLINTPATETHNRLFMAVHHLAIDSVSWRILVDGLEQAFKSIKAQQEIDFGKKGTSYREWVQAVAHYAQSPSAKAQLPYWQAVKDAYRPLPVDLKHAHISISTDLQSIMVGLSKEATSALLKDTSQAYGTEINDLLMAALAATISNWSGHEKVVIGLEGHGREESISQTTNISGTVGWFTNVYPIALQVAHKVETSDLIKQVKEQLREIPNKGMGFGALRYLHPSAEVRDSLQGWEWDIVFNYLGQFDAMASDESYLPMAPEPKGNTLSAQTPFHSKLELTSSISNGQFVMSWTYSSKDYFPETIEALANEFIEQLNALIKHCTTQQERTYTPADYGLHGKVEYQELDEFIAANEEEEDDEEIMRF